MMPCNLSVSSIQVLSVSSVVKKSQEQDYICELMLANCLKSVGSVCEDIADVRHLSTFLPLAWG